MPVRHRLRRALWIASLTAALLAIATLIAFKSSPWPSALLIRWAFERGGAATNATLSAHVPPGIRTESGLSYDPDDPAALLDIHRPSALDGRPCQQMCRQI